MAVDVFRLFWHNSHFQQWRFIDIFGPDWFFCQMAALDDFSPSRNRKAFFFWQLKGPRGAWVQWHIHLPTFRGCWRSQPIPKLGSFILSSVFALRHQVIHNTITASSQTKANHLSIWVNLMRWCTLAEFAHFVEKFKFYIFIFLASKIVPGLDREQDL